MNYFRHILLAGCTFLFLSACSEQIEINTEASPPQLVIYGYITTDTMQHAVCITRSSSYFTTDKPEGISNAKVSISYDGGVFELKESSEEPGVYLTAPNVYGISGKTYTLHASVDFSGNGKVEKYEATSYLPFPATLDSATVIPSPTVNNNLEVLVWGDMSKENRNHLSFHLFRNGVALTDSLKDFRVIGDDYITNKKFTALPVFSLNTERDKYKFSYGDTIVVQVKNFTTEYADFIGIAQKELLGLIPFFGGPPANILPNIRCLSSDPEIKVSGFFTAYPIRKTYTRYYFPSISK